MYANETDIRHILDVHGDALYRSAYLLLGNPHDVQDALQEVLLRFLEKAPSFTSAEHERAWLLRVTNNCCMDCLRFRRKHAYTDLDLLRECLPAPEQQAHLEELYALPAKWKSVLSQAEIDRIGGQLSQIPGVSSCRFVSGNEVRLVQNLEELKK